MALVIDFNFTERFTALKAEFEVQPKEEERLNKLILENIEKKKYNKSILNMAYNIPKLPLAIDVETKAVLRQLSLSHRKLAELKGVALTIPNENILINTLILQEAKDSSAVENIVTTHDDYFVRC